MTLGTALWGILNSSETKRLCQTVHPLSRRFQLLPQSVSCPSWSIHSHDTDQHRPANRDQHNSIWPLRAVFLPAFVSRGGRKEWHSASLLAQLPRKMEIVGRASKMVKLGLQGNLSSCFAVSDPVAKKML